MSLYDLEVLKLEEVHGADLAHIIIHSYEPAEDYIDQLANIQRKKEGFRLGENLGISSTQGLTERIQFTSFALHLIELTEVRNELWGQGYLTNYRGRLFIYRHTHFVEVGKEWAKRALKVVGAKCGVDIQYRNSAQFFRKFYEELQYSAHDPKAPAIGQTKVNFLNGVGTFDQHGNWIFKERRLAETPDYFCTYVLPFSYEVTQAEEYEAQGLAPATIEAAREMFDPFELAPNWMKFLRQVLPEEEAIWALHEFIGSCFISKRLLKLEKALFLIGEGSNGKSVIYDVIRALLGEQNVSGVSLEQLTNNRFQASLIEGKLLNYAPEVSAKFEPTEFKRLVSAEGVQFERKGKDAKEAKAELLPRIMFNGNQKPVSGEITHAIERRMVFIPFNVIIQDKDQDPELANKLKQELPGIWAIVQEGMRRLLKNKKLTHSPLIERENLDYKRTINSVHAWVTDERIVIDKGGWIPVREFYEEYAKWCYNSDMEVLPVKDFRRLLKIKGFETTGKRTAPHKGRRGWMARMPLPSEQSEVNGEPF